MEEGKLSPGHEPFAQSAVRVQLDGKRRILAFNLAKFETWMKNTERAADPPPTRAAIVKIIQTMTESDAMTINPDSIIMFQIIAHGLCSSMCLQAISWWR